MTLKKIILIMMICAYGYICAQESAFNAQEQTMASLPGEVINLTIMDGELYSCASGLLLKAERNGETLTRWLPDTSLAKLAPDAKYVVRHPSGDLYLTMPDRKGIMTLYRIQDPQKPKLKKVKMDKMSVEHPTFTTDGEIMIFASRDGKGVGGSDLWYSLFDDGEWTKPVNIGLRLNTTGDELSPTMYRDCLIFTSNGHNKFSEHMQLYATQLLSKKSTGDTVGMLNIGRSKLQPLPLPINLTTSNNYDIAVDTANGYGYWVSTRDGEPRIYSFNGTLDGVLLWGHVCNHQNQRLKGVRVSVQQNGKTVCHTETDDNGYYRLYLQSGHNYSLTFKLDNYFILHEDVSMARDNDKMLLSEKRLDTQMNKFPTDERMYYDNLFGPNADIELSQYGKETLNPLIQYLIDNPQMIVTLSLNCNITDNDSFNSLLTQQRLRTLMNYMYPQLPTSVKLQFIDGSATAKAANGISRLTVILTNGRK